MKSPHFDAPLSWEATELQRLATGLSESGSRLEESFWEKHLAELVQNLIKNDAEHELTVALDTLFDNNPPAYNELASMVEAQTESILLPFKDKEYDVQLFASPILAWSRYAIPTISLEKEILEVLKTQLRAHVFANQAHLALADYLFSPDQLPRNFCDLWKLTQELGECALSEQHLKLNTEELPETNRFLSDVRYLIGVVAVPQGSPIFRWNETDGSRQDAQAAWLAQGAPNLAPLFTGCAYQPLLADAYHAACRQADRDSRPYAISASIAFLETALGLMPEDIQAVVAPCYGQELEEYRIGLAPCNQNTVYHGIVWTLLGPEDEQTNTLTEIDAALRKCG
ncbi:MAG: DUF2863 family protein, partial [Azovibrio sp.]